MPSLRQLLASKGNRVWSIGPSDSVYDALVLLAEKDIGALPVIEDDKLVGIISERDYARKVILLGKVSVNTKISEIMTANVITVSPDTSVEEAMGLVTEKRIRHLPVMEEEQLVGIITIGDLVMSIITEQEVMINHLEDYVLGKHG